MQLAVLFPRHLRKAIGYKTVQVFEAVGADAEDCSGEKGGHGGSVAGGFTIFPCSVNAVALSSYVGKAGHQMKTHAAISMFIALAVTGCATKSENIGAYVSPMNYQNYTCEQLIQEGRSVSSRAAIAAGQQDKNRRGDAVATTVGVVLFWPALFFIDGDGPKAAEVASLKGQMDAIEQAAIQKKCQVTFNR